MEALETLVTRAQRGDPSAFEDIVRRFQDMAVGYGYSVLGDMALAEDAAQEAFLNAYRDLPMLRDPPAFPGWFRRIVFKHIDRVRRRGAQSVSLDLVREMSSHAPGPAEAAESRAVYDQVFAAIAQLPAHQRSVVTLFYIHDFSQEEIGLFLEIPVATVKTRLHAARKQLKERMIAVIQDNLPNRRPSRDDAFTQKVMALFRATVENDLSQVRALLKETPTLASASGLLRSALWNSETPALHVAVMYGRKDIVDLLLASGADINEPDKRWGFTALHQAIDLDFLPDYHDLGMVDFLLSRGAKKDIFAFLWVGDYEGAKALLDQNPALVNAVGPNNATPICHAYGPEMIQLVLDRGADLWMKMNDEWGSNTPLRWVLQHNSKFSEKVHFLLDRAGVETDISLACALGEADRVRGILGTDPALARAETPQGHVLEPGLTPLHLAAQFGRIEIATLLLERGADVNAASPLSYNLTPLHLVVWQGKAVEKPAQPLSELSGPGGVFRLLPDIPRLLLEHGASLTARDTLRNLTPLGYTAANLEDETDRSDVAALLKQFGARE